jgi:hypothetical protein
MPNQNEIKTHHSCSGAEARLTVPSRENEGGDLSNGSLEDKKSARKVLANLE